ncbi:hypothetical protein [Terriglobus aquaticus]|uniref:Glycosyltransferase RgtA/B/C/D-like domain-containing protein n=1 Tax=Terriglobus aquaticus TaxID=940139 RepID=A0ABW9KH51_9BACT|nr:hypothetical protein [Terriglobus aquaticus]
MSFRFHFGRPQRLAALVLLLFLGAALFTIGRAPLTESDYRYALCGREMWEKPSPALGYFTTCGNMQGDGTAAYRAAALPLTLYVQVLRFQDWRERRADAAKPPGERTYVANSVQGSVYDLRHQISGLQYLLRVPFALAAMGLGASLWWVCRRQFGNVAGFFALCLYCVLPPVLASATTPNNDILAAWGLFATIYTALGIAHAMYGPAEKWRPRIVLFTVGLGVTLCAHVLAGVVALCFAALFMLYVAERRRTLVLPLLIGSGLGALCIVFASYAFRLAPFFYVFTAGAARFTVQTAAAKLFFSDFRNLPLTATLALCLVLYFAVRRSRYFGNTAPLLVALALLPMQTTQLVTWPLLWAVPFLLTFAAGIFADALETRQRKLYLLLGGAVIATETLLAVTVVPSLHQ